VCRQRHPIRARLLAQTYRSGGSELGARATIVWWVGFDTDSTHAAIRIACIGRTQPEKRTVTVERKIKLGSPSVTVRVPFLTSPATGTTAPSHQTTPATPATLPNAYSGGEANSQRYSKAQLLPTAGRGTPG
jgi:hypothetical protein